MTPLETVLEKYSLPEYIKEIHPLQVETINDTATITNSGEWLDMGTGKTLCATVVGLYHKITYGHQVLVIMPPLLIWQWGRWLRSITPALSVCEYRGTPTERKAKDLNANFVLVGIQIFKKEIVKFTEHFTDKPLTVFVDEASMLGNIESTNHTTVYEFCIGRAQGVLTGTPINKPIDAYGLMKFSAPGKYRNILEFHNLHVAEWDIYKERPESYQNLDILAENILANSKRVLFEDMFKGTEEPLFIPIEYDLEPEHYKLYRKLAEEELLKLPDGGKIDATTAQKLLHALGQIIVNWGHFSGNPKHRSASIQMIEQKMEELNGGKLVVFANYKLTVAHLKEHLAQYGAVTINSEVSEVQKDRNLTAFTSDPKCRVIIIQFVSGGKGLDGLQHVCHDAFFVEPCQQPRDFLQCVARLKRIGQKKRVRVMMGIVNNTTQVRGFKALLANDELVNQVVRNAYDLRQLIYGK